MRLRFHMLLLAGLMLALAPTAAAQEVIPPEDRETIEPEEEKQPSQASPKTSVSEEHTVMNGDTLWDLCGRYLNNPWYWPRVWSYNPEITNPHWIFPGQVVRFYPGGEGPGQIDIISRDIDVPEPPEMELENEMLPPEDLVSMSGSIVGAKTVSSVSVLRNAFVTPEEMDYMGHIRASAEEVEWLHELSTIYIDFKQLSGVQPGQQFTIYRTMQAVEHPVTGEQVGYYTRVLGTCAVTRIAETSAVATITSSAYPIERGDRVGPLMEKLNKPVGPVANGVEVRGYIVGSKVTDLSMFGEHHLVFIDQGTEQGVKEGNMFDVVRREDALYVPGEGKEEGRWDKSMPAEIWARIMVVDARKTASTGLVIASLRELRVGDRVMMTVR